MDPGVPTASPDQAEPAVELRGVEVAFRLADRSDYRAVRDIDRELGHFRRYAKGELEDKMKRAGFMVERQFYFNKFGVIAWFLGNKIFKQKTLNRKHPATK